MNDKNQTNSPAPSDRETHPFLARLFFDHRKLWLSVLVVVTLFLGYHAVKIRPQAGFEKMVPLKHPYIQNFLANRADVQGGNIVRIAVEAREGENIFTDDYLQTLKEVTDEAFFLPGVDRARMKSLWTKNVQWIAVTEDGFDGGIVIPDAYDGSPGSIEMVKSNVMKSNQIGQLVANDFKSAIVLLPLLEINPETGKKLDYKDFSDGLEKIRDKMKEKDVNIYIIGVAKLLGDMIGGTKAIAVFFAIAFVITLALLYMYCRCIRGAIAPLICSVVAVIWQLGIMRALGYGLDPYSVLVPFLVFAIGVSHGVQMVNAVALEAGTGLSLADAGRQAFSDLFAPGIAALLSDAVGFATLIFIEIHVIQELAIAASIGVAAIIFSNLLLLPMLISILGLCQTGIIHATERKDRKSKLTGHFARFTRPGPAKAIIAVAVVLAALGYVWNKDLKIGDLDKGAPELRPDSRYNQDVAFVTENYSASSDVMVVMVKTPKYMSVSYKVLDAIDRLQWELDHVEGVQGSVSVANVGKFMSCMLNEGNPKWFGLSRDQKFLNNTVYSVPEGLISGDSSLSNLIIFLDDHKAETLERVTTLVERFDKKHGSDEVKYLLAAGSAGIEAATNQSIAKSQVFMLVFVYSVVSIMVLLTFRSIRAVICIIVPLMLTSLLCQALMAKLGIGVKVATLPVIALGVGIGVDYGIYIFSMMRYYLNKGADLDTAFSKTLMTTGRAVTFTGLTLAVGVFTWVFSPLKFQADMGILLTFMFLWNMLGVMTLLPALAHFLIKPASGNTVTGKQAIANEV
jgi:predicted RND superfamily exporter protein